MIKRRPSRLSPPYTPSQLKAICLQIASGRGYPSRDMVKALAERLLELEASLIREDSEPADAEEFETLPTLH